MSDLARYPYRSAALRVVPSHVERSFCPWCAHVSGSGSTSKCRAPANLAPWGSMPWCDAVNRDGRCAQYSPSLVTRLARALRLRSPVLIECEE